jgi:D-arabinose 1-dehydrogenase-like Zn-dependent alcohol dehydrogenase
LDYVSILQIVFFFEEGTDVCMATAPAGTAMAGADPLLFVGKNLHVIGTKVGSLLDTEKALQFAARVCSSTFSTVSQCNSS